MCPCQCDTLYTPKENIKYTRSESQDRPSLHINFLKPY